MGTLFGQRSWYIPAHSRHYRHLRFPRCRQYSLIISPTWISVWEVNCHLTILERYDWRLIWVRGDKDFTLKKFDCWQALTFLEAKESCKQRTLSFRSGLPSSLGARRRPKHVLQIGSKRRSTFSCSSRIRWSKWNRAIQDRVPAFHSFRVWLKRFNLSVNLSPSPNSLELFATVQISQTSKLGFVHPNHSGCF